jgi:hypothetical protein
MQALNTWCQTNCVPLPKITFKRVGQLWWKACSEISLDHSKITVGSDLKKTKQLAKDDCATKILAHYAQVERKPQIVLPELKFTDMFQANSDQIRAVVGRHFTWEGRSRYILLPHTGLMKYADSVENLDAEIKELHCPIYVYNDNKLAARYNAIDILKMIHNTKGFVPSLDTLTQHHLQRRLPTPYLPIDDTLLIRAVAIYNLSFALHNGAILDEDALDQVERLDHTSGLSDRKSGEEEKKLHSFENVFGASRMCLLDTSRSDTSEEVPCAPILIISGIRKGVWKLHVEEKTARIEWMSS